MTDLPLPTSGGSYIRRPDGTLEREEPAPVAPAPDPEIPEPDETPLNEG